MPGARTFEAQLDDGHWLQISERRTKDGGYVSVGTDITALKLHEEKLIDSEQRLIATVADLRSSQQKLEVQAQQLADLAEKYCRGEDPRRGGQPGQVEVPRQYEPRAAHAAQRHHRLLRDHGVRACSARSAPTNITNIAATSARAAQYLLDVINDILDMSKIEAGRIKLDLEEVELDRSLADAHARGRPRAAQDKQLDASPRGSRPTSSFEADRRALKQIALNLLSNAVKFTPGGRPDHGARPRVARLRRDRHPGHRHRHRRGRAAEARPAVRAGRKPAHQDPSRLGPRPRHRQIAGRTAWRRACASARRSATARWWWCACRSMGDRMHECREARPRPDAACSSGSLVSAMRRSSASRYRPARAVPGEQCRVATRPARRR